MKTGVYIGSFNPVHKGHIYIVKECLRQKLVDRVLIIPTGNYWHKNNLYDLSLRVRMCKNYENEKIKIGEDYEDCPYTADIFRKLQKRYPEDELKLIIGGDNIERFSEWKEYEYLLSFPFIIIKRDRYDNRFIEKMMKQFDKDNYEILDIENIEISSTYIRNNLDDYEKIKDMIDKQVYQCLIKRKE